MHLNKIGLLVQPFINMLPKIEPHIESLNSVFNVLNKYGSPNKDRCIFILQHAQYTRELGDALCRLLKKETILSNEKIIDALCMHPKFSKSICSIFIIFDKNNIYLEDEIINLVCENASYAVSLNSACCILDDQLNKETFISLCQNPKQAIQSALTRANMSIDEAKKTNESGIQDFVKTQEISLTMAGTGGGLLVGKSPFICPSVKNLKELTFFAFVPKDILCKIASLSGINTLEPDVRNQLIDLNLISPCQKLLNAAQSLLTLSEENKITAIELKEQTMNIYFNSPQDAKEFYRICNQHSNIYQWTYDFNASSPKSEIVFKNLNQIQYFISTICKLNFNDICMGYPEFNVVPEETPNPSPNQVVK